MLQMDEDVARVAVGGVILARRGDERMAQATGVSGGGDLSAGGSAERCDVMEMALPLQAMQSGDAGRTCTGCVATGGKLPGVRGRRGAHPDDEHVGMVPLMLGFGPDRSKHAVDLGEGALF